MRKYCDEARSLLALAIPVIVAQVSQTAMGVVDTIMAGAYSATDMSAVAVGASIWLPTILFGHGLLLAITPIIAQYNGSGRRDYVAHQVNQALWLALFLSILIILVLYNSQHVILNMHNVDPILAEKAVNYLHALMWGAPGYLFYQTLRNQCEGLSKTKPGMVIGFIGILINIPINYIFIYGKWGMPALGGVGCGIATAVVYWLMYFMLHWYIRHTPSQQDILQHQKFEWPVWHSIKRLINLGLPVALAVFCEVTLFAIVALLVSPLGVTAVAGHQIAISFSSLMFVLPMSFAVSATIRVGHCLGEKSPEKAKTAAYTSLMVGFGVSILTALLTFFYREPIALLYNTDPTVVAMAGHLLLFAAIYQCSDSIQVIGSGILRGYKDTRPIFYITFISYWLIGLPVGYLLGLTNYIVPLMGPRGFWIGFIFGLTTAAIMLMMRMTWLQKQSTDRILHQSTQ